MAVCTFFGHREVTKDVKRKLKITIEDLICNKGVTEFFVGNQGQYDSIVLSVLKELKLKYSNINYFVVLAYMPKKDDFCFDYKETLLPEGIENVYPRFAISWRNEWMLKRADYVVVYITHNWGGAAQYAEKAERKGKKVINIADV